tara:strand:+ start:181 stop:561 length:381 start_codon:yes stop_codon:yes gene_type:complete
MHTFIRHIKGWVAILLCYLAGHILVDSFAFPLPAALTGLLILLALLLWRGRQPASVSAAASPLLSHMSVLFVPAVLGVGLYWEDIQANGVSLALAICVSTGFCLGLAGAISQKFLQSDKRERNDNV